MRFRRGRKSFGLIALLSCVFTATVAFAAYTGYNYINGTVSVEGSPFNMVFANADGTDLVNNTIKGPTDPFDPEKATGLIGGAEASDITVTDDGTKIESFNVKLTSELDESMNRVGAAYSFSIRNDGGAPAYLSAIEFAGFDMPKAGDGSSTEGLGVMVGMYEPGGDSPLGALNVLDGELVVDPPYVSAAPVPPGEFARVTVVVYAEQVEDGQPVWAAVDEDGNYGATITIPEIKLTWSAVPPAGSGT